MANTDSSSVDLTALLNQDAHLSRVPNFLVNSKQQAHYTPQFISLGAYHCDNRKLKDAHVEGVDRISSNDLYKRKFVRKQLKIERFYNLDDIVQVPIIEVNRFYNLNKGNNFSRIAQMMLMDSLFLLCFLSPNNGDHGDYDVVIKCDILKLDNQIPLFVLKDVCDFVKQPMATLLRNAYTELSPFELSRDENIDAFNDAIVKSFAGLYSRNHLLGCIHAIVSRFLEIEADSDSTPTPTLLPTEGDSPSPEPTPTLLPIKGYNAVQLASAGIKFESFSTLSSKIRFDKESHTLYLPQMTVSSLQTEVFFRNLVAMEFNDGTESINSDKHVTRFIQLTDCLIDTADDVNVLRKSQVITSESEITDETIAIIWKSLHHPYYRGHLQPPKELKRALDDVLGANYCKIKIRMGFSDFFHYYYQKYFSHPWSFLAMLAGIFFLALTVIQTYCSLRGCSSMVKLYANL